MKENKLNPNEEEFLESIKDFFQTRSLKEHLLFVDYWMELVLAGKTKKKWTNPSNLYFLYGKLIHLFKDCDQILQNNEYLRVLEPSSLMDDNALANEKHNLIFYPYHLKNKELCQPFKALKNIFNEQDIYTSKEQLEEWLADGLHGSSSGSYPNYYLAPLYRHLKKLIEACWLIHERVITKNSFESPKYSNSLLNYALTEPALFTPKEIKDPFSVIESFFNFTNLSGYREELQKGYIAAISEELSHESPNSLLFIHNQYISLIQAGYLIVSKNLNYVPKADRPGGITLGKWILSVRDKQAREGKIELSDETVHALNIKERANPIAYCKQTLTHENVIKLRFGLKEWLYAGLSSQSNIANFEEINPFELYLTLQKLTEAFYLIITANAEEHVLSLTNTSYEV